MTSPKTPLRTGVVGVGHLGRHHARLLAGMKNVNLVGVFDTDESRAREVAGAQETRVFPALEPLLQEVEALTVAVPTMAHHQVAAPALSRGIPCLVEKPLAADLEAGHALVAAARQGGTILMVGQTERFNPALAAAKAHVHRPGFVEAQRLGSFSTRSTDIDVILDLMIHDVDAVLDLVGEKPSSVDAVGVAALTEKIDLANARLRFPSGCAANLTASRMSLGQVRKLRVFQPDAYISVDFNAREALKYSLVRGAGTLPSIQGETLAVEEGEPLGRELEEFVAAVLEQRQPRCSGEEGLAALETAIRIRDCMDRIEAEPRADGD